MNAASGVNLVSDANAMNQMTMQSSNRANSQAAQNKL